MTRPPLIKAPIRYYRLDLDVLRDKAEYDRLFAEMQGKRVQPWIMESPEDPSTAAFRYKIRKVGEAGEVLIETQFLFSDQFNTVGADERPGLRLHEWAEYDYPNKKIKEGYIVDLPAEYKDLLAAIKKCGYCGAEYDPDNTPADGFCTRCLGSPHLTEKDLPLLRLTPISNTKRREKLSDAEAAIIMPRFIEAQIIAENARIRGMQEKRIREIHKTYAKHMRNAEREKDGFLWALNYTPGAYDNLIYYKHTGSFCFGWRGSEGLDPVIGDKLLETMRKHKFPAPCDIKVRGATLVYNPEV